MLINELLTSFSYKSFLHLSKLSILHQQIERSEVIERNLFRIFCSIFSIFFSLFFPLSLSVSHALALSLFLTDLINCCRWARDRLRLANIACRHS